MYNLMQHISKIKILKINRVSFISTRNVIKILSFIASSPIIINDGNITLIARSMATKRQFDTKNKKRKPKRKRYYNDTISSFDLSSITTENRKQNPNNITIAIEGCCYGKLNTICTLLQKHQVETNTNIDLLIICGDF